MELAVHLAQPRSTHVRVNLGRADAGVAEQFLNDPEVRAVLEQVRRETVAQHVGRDVARDARLPHRCLMCFQSVVEAKAVPWRVRNTFPGVRGGRGRPAPFQVAPQRLLRRLMHRHHSFLVSLAITVTKPASR
jgi:hypothetical protein